MSTLSNRQPAMTLAVMGCAVAISLSGCGGLGGPPEQAETSEAVPSAVDVAETDPVDVAQAGLRAYCSTELPQEQWKAGLVLYLSKRGRTVYMNTSVSRVDECTVDGLARDPETDGNLLQYVAITTDGGEWLVTVSREAEAAPWRVDAFTPPPEPGGTQPPHTDSSQPDV
ncbi:hypothetical protein [Brevibacterium casei]|nr:hypothetical protein [Brevibacterium casei]